MPQRNHADAGRCLLAGGGHEWNKDLWHPPVGQRRCGAAARTADRTALRGMRDLDARVDRALKHDRVRLLNLSDDMLAKTMTWSVIGSSA